MNSVIAPTVTAYDLHEYRRQIECIAEFSPRIHIDLMDGIFAPTKSPDIDKIWLIDGIECDVHLMFQHPYNQIRRVLKLDPSLVIIQAEANEKSVDKFIDAIKKTKIRVGMSVLPETDIDEPRIADLVRRVDHVLIFSGHLGFHGGIADMQLLNKVMQIKGIKSTVEIGWDGGINADNIHKLSTGGVQVLNIGGAIQKALDPARAFDELSLLLQDS